MSRPHFCLPTLALLVGCGGSGFMHPRAVPVGFPDMAAVPAESSQGTNTQDGPRVGYLRIWTTTNLTGITRSWPDDKARRKFKRVLITIQRDGSNQKIPVLTLDITGKTAAGTELIDKDLGNLSYVEFDSGDKPGTGSEPRLILEIHAVPKTAADIADTIANFGKEALNQVPILGTAIAQALPFGSAGLVKDMLSFIDKEADAYKNKIWIRAVDGSIRASMALPRGTAAWVFMPEEENQTDQDKPFEPVGPRAVAGARDTSAKAKEDETTTVLPIEVPSLVACDQTAQRTGRLTHLCTEDERGALHMYEGHAWITMQFELLPEPASDLIPPVECEQLGNGQSVEDQIKAMLKYELSQTHQTERSAYIDLYRISHRIANSNGASRVRAFEDWLEQSGIELFPAHEKKSQPSRSQTWSVINKRVDALTECVRMIAKPSDVRWYYDEAKQLRSLAVNNTNDATAIYTLIEALDLVLADPSSSGARDEDVGRLTRERLTKETRLYKLEIEKLTTASNIETKLAMYPRCAICQRLGKEHLQKFPPSRTSRGVPVADAGLERILREGNIDTSALERLREATANLANIEADQKASREARDAARVRLQDDSKKAEMFLIQSLGVSETAARMYLTPSH